MVTEAFVEAPGLIFWIGEIRVSQRRGNLISLYGPVNRENAMARWLKKLSLQLRQVGYFGGVETGCLASVRPLAARAYWTGQVIFCPSASAAWSGQ